MSYPLFIIVVAMQELILQRPTSLDTLASHLEECSPETVMSSMERSFQMRAQWDVSFLTHIAEVDRRELYLPYGFTSTASWLATTYGLGFNRSQELVEVAVGLRDLDQMRKAYGESRLSFDHLRALVQVATSENEEALLKEAEGRSVKEVFALVERKKEISKEEAEETRRQRFLEKRWDKKERVLYLFGALPEEMGIKFSNAIDRLTRGMPDDKETTMAQRRADALVALSDANVPMRSSRDQVVVHLKEDADTGRAVAELQAGPVVSLEAARAIACDARIQYVIEKASGDPIAITKCEHRVPDWLARLVFASAGGRCQFTGCNRTTCLEIHHIDPKGPTEFGNLMVLCSSHHHNYIHHGGYEIVGKSPNISIIAPNGKPMKVGPPKPSAEVIAAFDLEFAMEIEAAGRGP